MGINGEKTSLLKSHQLHSFLTFSSPPSQHSRVKTQMEPILSSLQSTPASFSPPLLITFLDNPRLSLGRSFLGIPLDLDIFLELQGERNDKQRNMGKKKQPIINNHFFLHLLGSSHKIFYLITVTLLKDFGCLSKVSKALTSKVVIQTL